MNFRAFCCNWKTEFSEQSISHVFQVITGLLRRADEVSKCHFKNVYLLEEVSCASTLIFWPQLSPTDRLLTYLEPPCWVVNQPCQCPAILPIVLHSLSGGVQWLPSHSFGRFPASDWGLWRSQLHKFQRPMDQLCMLLCLAEALGESTCFSCTGLKQNLVMAMLLLLYDCFAVFFKGWTSTYADGCRKQILTSQGGSLQMEMREIFLFEEGGQCYWRKKGIVVPKTFWPELAKTQLNNPDKIMMISLAARIVSV